MKLASLALGVAFLFVPATAFAANVDVQMLNKGDEGTFVFQPDLIKVPVGDTVTFQPTDKGHNVDLVATDAPPNATPFKGTISQPLTETFTVPGVYVVRCDPHYGLGMVAVIVVGNDLSNLDAIKAAKNPQKAQDRLNTLLAEVGK